jgi:nitric oxide reductase subunit C
MRANLYIFLSLCLLFLAFSYLIYSRPRHERVSGASAMTGEGRLVWQKYNCQSCHQLYGLGGYLGPDLTNVLSEKGKGEDYVLGLVRSGIRQMPSFTMTAAEESRLIDFLRATNASGNADPRKFSRSYTGMIAPE